MDTFVLVAQQIPWHKHTHMDIHTFAHTCSSTATSCRAGLSRGPRIQLKIWPMLAESISKCVCVRVCVLYVCQPLPCRSACSMFLTHRERNGKGREGEGLKGGGGVWSGSRGGRLKRPGRNSLGYKGMWADTHLMRGHIWAASQEKQILV